MHGSQHAGDKFVNSIALLDKGHKRSDATLVVSDVAKVRKDKFLELLNLVLQHHEVTNRLVALVRVVEGFKAQILLLLEGTVELGMLVMEGELG